MKSTPFKQANELRTLDYLFDLLKSTPAKDKTIKIEKHEFLSNLSSPQSKTTEELK